MPRQLAWCKRPAEDGKMFVQLEPWALLRRKSHVVWHFSIKEAIPSFDTRRARATNFDAHTQRLVRLQLPAPMKSDLLCSRCESTRRTKLSLLFLGEEAPRW